MYGTIDPEKNDQSRNKISNCVFYIIFLILFLFLNFLTLLTAYYFGPLLVDPKEEILGAQNLSLIMSFNKTIY